MKFDCSLPHPNATFLHLQKTWLSPDISIPQYTLFCFDCNKQGGAEWPFAPSYCLRFNKSITICTLPSDGEIASIIPVPKSPNLSTVTNYWPISLFSIINKLCERHISYLVIKHLDFSDVLLASQWRL